MELLKVHKAQAAKLVFLVLSLTLIPFVSSSLRPSYLYFLLNILIVALGYESGLLHVLTEPDMEKKKKKPIGSTAPAAAPVPGPPDTHGRGGNGGKLLLQPREGSLQGKPVVLVMAAAAEQTLVAAVKTAAAARVGAAHSNMKRASSVPSIFFIGSCDEEGDTAAMGDDVELEEEEEEEEDVLVAAGEISGRELFARAESFIGNFYNQLKIQREESWKNIHGLYHRTAF